MYVTQSESVKLTCHDQTGLSIVDLCCIESFIWFYLIYFFFCKFNNEVVQHILNVKGRKGQTDRKLNVTFSNLGNIAFYFSDLWSRLKFPSFCLTEYDSGSWVW